MNEPNPALLTKVFGLLRRIEETELPRGVGLLGLGTRLVFASVLLRFFWSSALTKIDGFGLSLNAYAQIFPRKMEALGYDPSQLAAPYHFIAAFGTIAEFVLPLFILIGLFTRLSSLAMIGFIGVMTLTDIYGHGLTAETIGGFFNRFQDEVIADQRLLWVWMLIVLGVIGGGKVAVDRLLFPQPRKSAK